MPRVSRGVSAVVAADARFHAIEVVTTNGAGAHGERWATVEGESKLVILPSLLKQRVLE
jgi:hypothetical protein